MGARQFYSTLNGIATAVLCFTGTVTLVLHVVPLETTLGILLWIGLIILAQSFQETPREHALAVGFGLIPSLAAWALLLVDTSLRVAGTSLFESIGQFGNQLYVSGMISLSQGFLLTSMILASVMVGLIRRDFRMAAVWLAIASFCSFVGLIHAYELTGKGVENSFALPAAPKFSAAYLILAILTYRIGRGLASHPATKD